MKTPVARVGDLCEQIRGVTYAKDDASSEPGPGYVAILRANNITEAGLDCADLVFVPKAKVAQRQYLRLNDVLIATSSGSLDVVGKAARVVKQDDFAFGAFCKVLRPNHRVHPAYFAHYFQTRQYREKVSSLAAGANINNLRNEHLDNLEMPLPPMPEQLRLAKLLDQAADLVALRREALNDTRLLMQSLLVRAFNGAL